MKKIFLQIYATLGHITQVNEKSPFTIKKLMAELKEEIDALPDSDHPYLTPGEESYLGSTVDPKFKPNTGTDASKVPAAKEED